MSSNKRRHSLDKATKGNGDARLKFLRKKPRLSSVKDLERAGKFLKPIVVEDDERKQPPATIQSFRPHRQLAPVSAQSRPSNGSKERPTEKSTLFSPNSYPYSRPPEEFDVSPGLPDAVHLADGETSSWKAGHAAFIRSTAGLSNSHWIGKRPLGSGGFGTAGLWELRDENNVQIVIKESKTVSSKEWTGEVPEEVKMMQRMNKTNCEAVPELLAYKRYKHVRKHRIYMEFCPYSDLEALNLRYKRFRAYFPEPFLWHTFKDLVQAAAAMKNGPEFSHWGYQIVHRDLKPGNIFLGLEDESSGFRMYPAAKTGDWGLATKIKHGDNDNPVLLRGAGTEPYFPPEQRVPSSGVALMAQIHKHLDGTARLQKLSAHTNVWAIGAIMFELLTHEAVAYYLNDEEWTVNEVFKDIPNVRNPKYSGALTELIRLCLMPDPWDRPSIEELELKIGARWQSISDAYATNPSLQRKDRLYFRGSEINQMPPGNWNYWRPVMKDVPNPSDSPGRLGEVQNPFTDRIVYPRFPTSELSNLEEKLAEEPARSGNGSHDKGHLVSKGRKGDRVGKPVVISNEVSSAPRGNNSKNPIIISDSVKEDGMDSDDSGDSEVRRRMAIKKLPGT